MILKILKVLDAHYLVVGKNKIDLISNWYIKLTSSNYG